ncbi:hydrolase [Temperatibacter marinus]|uniref:Hydrolase n=1 Tax=Temperatibacter marinus TaxID=1456591 RepID=A0AA52H9B4_9PROT|nr:hydrolase [Temperatibacter marinus]WND01463.1 hydrolase [Temperatibacter marinus]
MDTTLTSFIKSEDCTNTLDWISKQHDLMVQTVQEWSLINSGSRNLSGLEKMTQIVADFARPLGADIDYISLEDTEVVNDRGEAIGFQNAPILRLRKRPKANRRLLLTGHLDTVFPVESDFQSPTWLNDSLLNGPGVADMKGGIIVMLMALMALEKSPFAERIGWEILLSPDEETGSLASAPVLMQRAKAADMGLTYEPAMPDGTMAGERKGSGNFTCVVFGKEAHAGRAFYEGRNAVVALGDLIGKLAALSGQREGLTVNPAVIQGGTAANVVPDLAQCKFNVRLERVEDQQWFETALENMIDTANKQDGITVKLYGGINRPPKVITAENQLMMDLIAACGAELGQSIQYIPTGGCCEGNNLAAAGLPNVDTLGVIGGYIHSDQEYVDVTSFVPRVQLSACIMMAFAEGYFNDVLRKGGKS